MSVLLEETLIPARPWRLSRPSRFAALAGGLILAIAVALLPQLATAPPAQAAGDRSISGVVTLAPGASASWMAGVEVSASSLSGGSFGSAKPDPQTGAYTIRDLTPGSYRVQFSTTGYRDGSAWAPRPNLVSEYFRDTTSFTSATPVNVSTADAADVDAELAIGRKISGTVTLPPGTDPDALRAISVSASGDVPSGSVTVDPASGSYSLTGLVPGTYRVQFSVNSYWDFPSSTTVTPNLASEFYDDAPDWSSAVLVDVTSGDMSDVDAAMDAGRSISGTVTLPDGAPDVWMDSIYVTASGVDVGSFKSAKPDPTTGEYTITGLSPAAYTVAFRSSSNTPGTPAPNLVEEYWDDALTSLTAQPVDVTAGDRTGIDASLSSGRSIAGTVTLPADAPAAWLGGVYVAAVDQDGNYVGGGSAVDPATGKYSIDRLMPGDYRVRFSAGSYFDGTAFQPTDLASEYYDDAPTFEDAAVLSVGSDDVGGIDATLEHGASISGKIDLSALGAADGRGVGVTLTDAGGKILSQYGDAFPADGSYELSFSNLAPGTYRVAVEITSWDEATQRSTTESVQYLRSGGKSSIQLNAGDALTGVALQARAADASLAGSISAEGFSPAGAENIYGNAFVYERLDGAWVRLPDVRMDATALGANPYAFALAPGKYTVGFEAYVTTLPDSSGIHEEWWNKKPTLADADTVELASKQHRTGVDGTIRLGDAPTEPVEPTEGAVPVYRFYSDVYKGHFFTTSASERDMIIARWPTIWTYEGPRYNAFTTQVPGTVPLYRFWSEQYHGHFYTSSAAERDHVIATWPDVWTSEGIAYYVYPTDSTVADTVPVARFWSPTALHHFYTASSTERDEVIRRWPLTWTYEKDDFRVPAAGIPGQ
ncbi:hypothetical protein ACLQ2Q_01295 [Microbacterium sp. DT81.1]|uniref:hypothetical protein n=1 Tax=Microbacterium sp. DT81.1 TaxID=3393413 RepID=UPI003CEBB6BB